MIRQITIALLFLGLFLTFGTYSYGEELSLEAAVKQVKKDTQAKVLSADERQVGGKPMYRIKVISKQGVVKVIWVDPKP